MAGQFQAKALSPEFDELLFVNMKNVPQISAIIPIHRWSEVKENIERLLGLEFINDVFLIFVLDSCTAEEKLELEVLLAANQIKSNQILTGDYGSAGDSRNAGLDSADTAWVCFWDSDDLPQPVGYCQLLSFASQVKCDLVVGQLERLWVRDGKIVNRSTTSTHSLWSFARDPGFTRILYKTSLIRDLSFPPFSLGEDVAFLASILFKNPIIRFSDEKVYTYILGKIEQASSRFRSPKDQRAAARYIYSNRPMDICILYNAVIDIMSIKLLLGIVKRFSIRQSSESICALYQLIYFMRARTILQIAKLISLGRSV